MRFILLIISFFFLLFSCSDKHKIPRGVLGQQKMYTIIWDLARADEFVNNYVRQDSAKNPEMETLALYEQIFRSHNTTQEIFRRSLDFYASRPDMLKVMMDSLRSYERKVMYEPPVSTVFTDSAKGEKRLDSSKFIKKQLRITPARKD